MNPSRVRWGIMLILIGLVFLAINLGKLSWWIWVDLLNLWPVLLIAIGLELIVKKSKLQYLGYLSTLLIIGAFAWVIYDNGGFGNDAYGSYPSSRNEATLAYANETTANLSLDFSRGRLYFNSDANYLVRATTQNSRSSVELQRTGTVPACSVTVTTATRHITPLTTINSNENHWKCYVHPEVLVNYDLKLDDTDFRFFAQDLKVDTIRIDAEHSDLLVKLGNHQAHSYLNVTGRNSDLDLYIPDSVGIRLEGNYPPTADNAALKLTDRGGYLVNDLYEKASVNFQIKTDLGSGRLKVSTY